MFMTQQELKELTGLSYPKKQARYLSERGYKFEQRADGRIIMLKCHVEDRLGAKQEKKQFLEPDFDALTKLMSGKDGKKKRK